MRGLAIGAILGLLTTFIAPARPSPASLETDVEVQTAILDMARQAHAPGMVVAVVRGDETSVQGFGEVRPRSGFTPDSETLVRLGSISKLFAGETMTALAQERRLALTDPLQRWAPPGVRAPEGVRLVDLATHTSGLPRLANLAYAADPERASRARWDWLNRWHGGRAPGSRAIYSNIAFDVLADALSRAAAEPYPAALRRRITGPWGMADTTPSPNRQQCARLMDGGYAGAWGPCRATVTNAGSGGLYSTADDMALWMRRQLGLDGHSISPALAASQAIYVRRESLIAVDGLDRAGPAAGIGLGWIELAPTATHPRLLEKTGGGWGFMTYVAIAPGRRTGVFVALTTHDVDAMPRLSAQVNDLVGRLAR